MAKNPLKITDTILQENRLDEVLLESGTYNTNPAYLYSSATVLRCWGILLLIMVLSACTAVLLLEFIDKDKR